MATVLMDRLALLSRRALESGDLLPVQSEQTIVQQQGLDFHVRWVPTLAVKDKARESIPGGPRDPDFNPFLPPDPALTLADQSHTHNIILNKFAVCDLHLVLADKVFSEQLSPLREQDFSVLADLLLHQGGLGFYNGGAMAGASQRHKHVQWVPAASNNASLEIYRGGLPLDAPHGHACVHPVLPFRHVFVRLGSALDGSAMARLLLDAYQRACAQLGLQVDEQGLLPSHNMLAGQGWMLVVPRKQELVEDISINALSYGGCIYVREPEQIDLVRRLGPLQVLTQAAHAWPRESQAMA